MDDSGFQIEDPGHRLRKLPERTRKPLSGVVSDSSGQMPAANQSQPRASGEMPLPNLPPLADRPFRSSAEVPFVDLPLDNRHEDSSASSQTVAKPAANFWRDSPSGEIPASRPEARTGSPSAEVRTARLSNSSGEIPKANLDQYGDPRAAGGRNDRNSKLQERRSQQIERRRSSGEWRVSGEHRVPTERRRAEDRLVYGEGRAVSGEHRAVSGERKSSEETAALEERRNSEERRLSGERRVSQEFRIASEERRVAGDRRNESGELRNPYTETGEHLSPADGWSGELRAQPQQNIPPPQPEPNQERWTLLQDRRVRSGDHAATVQDGSQSQGQLKAQRSASSQERPIPQAERRSQQRRVPAETPRSSQLKGPITITVLSVLLIAYAFNFSIIQVAAEGMVAGWNSPDQPQASAAVEMLQRAIPYLVALPPLLLLYGVLSSVAGVIGLRRSRLQKERSKRGSHTTPLDRFKEQAESEGVRPRYAYQAFLLLEQHVPQGHELSTEDGLEDDLALSPAQVRTLRMSLLHNTDRAVDPNGRLAPVDTVLAMLLSAQQMPRRQRDPLDPVFVPGDPKTGRSR